MADGGNKRIIDMVEVAESFFRGGKIPPREVIVENESREETEKLYELNKLEEYLKANNIPYERIDEKHELTKQGWWHIPRHQIAVPNLESLATEEYEFDVICHEGSFGYEEGLLEIMGSIVTDEDGDRVVGYLTAEDVIERIKKAKRGKNNGTT